MAKGVLFLTFLLPNGKGADAVKYLKELEAPKGIKTRYVYFTLGRCDGIRNHKDYQLEAFKNYWEIVWELLALICLKGSFQDFVKS